MYLKRIYYLNISLDKKKKLFISFLLQTNTINKKLKINFLDDPN